MAEMPTSANDTKLGDGMLDGDCLYFRRELDLRPGAAPPPYTIS